MRIGFIGAGQMATAIAKGFVEHNIVPAESICAFDSFPDAMNDFSSSVCGIHSLPSGQHVVDWSTVVVLAVKPGNVPDVSASLNAMPSDKLLVSICAGVPIRKLSDHFGTDRLARVMPNTPCLVGKGASAFSLGPAATEEDGKLVLTLFSSIGYACKVKEELLDAVTGLSGSGPAFVYQFIESLSDGGVKMGLPRAIATELAAQTVLGAATMVTTSGRHTGTLKDQVASPGGTTIAGLHELERGGLRAAIMNAVEAASIRSAELGK